MTVLLFGRSHLTVEANWFYNDMLVSESGLLRPSILLEGYDIGFEQDIQITAYNTHVSVEYPRKFTDRFYIVFCDGGKQPLAFWG